MQLTGKEIIEKNIISNYSEKAIQQQGIDVRVSRIWEVMEGGRVPTTGKTILPESKEVRTEYGYYKLLPGYYEVQLEEGCKIPNNATLHFKTRSSLVRCGALVHSGQFDAGFETDKMGCFLQVIQPIAIEKGARIAQAIIFESNIVENLYDGQWQNDKQRK